METHRVMYDTLALAAALFPAILFWPVILGAPAALYIVVRRWNTPLSVLPRTKIRYVLAAAIALAEIAGIVTFIWALSRIPRARM